jgi:hypothetical protein
MELPMQGTIPCMGFFLQLGCHERPRITKRRCRERRGGGARLLRMPSLSTPCRQLGKRSATLAGPTKAPGGLSSVLAFQTLSGRPAARVTGVDCWMPLMGTVVLGMSWNERYHPHRKSHTSRWRVLSLNGSGGMTRRYSMRRTELTHDKNLPTGATVRFDTQLTQRGYAATEE